MKRYIKKCIGYGNTENKCNNKIDKKISLYWCPECEKIRRETISKQLENLCNVA